MELNFSSKTLFEYKYQNISVACDIIFIINRLRFDFFDIYHRDIKISTHYS